MIDATNIYRTFKTGTIETHVLKGVDVHVAEGEFVAIMGKSGAGKSTLLYQLSLLDTPNEGSLSLNRVDVLTLSEQEKTLFRLNTLGFIFQDYALVPDLTARENVMMPLLMRGEKWVDASLLADSALDSVGLVGKYNNLPGQLSGGEQQRTSIARAIVGKPKILFADEPTANLDSVSGEQVVALLGELNARGQTIVMVTHEPEYTHQCNRIISMEDGRIVKEKKQRRNKH
ncbi:ABC transporter ATP-binding protein [Patescibacteria group bacterium]|nr:ABC transporter ATP-binding protein [Patescibacteria group bacterium]